MTTTVFLFIMAAALLHASWNAIIKIGGNKMSGMLIMTLVQAMIGVVVITGRVLPHGEVWLWLLGSGLFHSAYKIFLAYAYDQGDLSRVYPIARGAAPVVVMGVGALFLTDVISGREYLGIAVLGIGILMMARGVFASGESRRLVPFALGSAMATAGYSLVDGLGARQMGDAVAYVAWLFIFDALIFTPVSIGLKGTVVLRANRRAWGLGAIAAMGSYGAYAIAVWAMTVAPIALVAALRETSILFAVLIGWAIFGETMTRGKVLAVILIVTGVILTRI
ncbi:EamA family transporter [Profundibacter sp.]